MYVFEDDNKLIQISEDMTTLEAGGQPLIPIAKTRNDAEIFRRWYKRQTQARASRVSIGGPDGWRERLTEAYETSSLYDLGFVVDKVLSDGRLHGFTIDV